MVFGLSTTEQMALMKWPEGGGKIKLLVRMTAAATAAIAATAATSSSIFCQPFTSVLTQHGGLLDESIAGLKGHLLEGRGVGADGVTV